MQEVSRLQVGFTLIELLKSSRAPLIRYSIMTNKRAPWLSLICLLLAAIGGWQLAMFSPRASAEPVRASSQGSPAPTAKAITTFEYKILNLPFSEAFSRPTGAADKKGRPLTMPSPFLEDEINKLAAEGYVVESFQKASSVFGTGLGGGFTIGSSSEFVVLLKRERR